MTTAPAPVPMRTWRERAGPWLFAILALAPLLWCRAEFAELFWFGDDWDLLDNIDQLGFWSWLWTVFAENFVPVFKLVWGALALGSGGSYFPMIVALWVTHALNVALLGQWLRAEGFGWIATALTLGVFALAAVNIETLGWSVQLSPILAVTFFLAAARWHAHHDASTRPYGWRVHGVLAALVAASALSFSRGVLTGVALAAASFVPIAAGPWRVRSRALTAGICLLPCVVVAVLIAKLATGNHRSLGESGQFEQMVQFGLYYLAMNPLHQLVHCQSFEVSTALAFGVPKLILVVWCVWASTGRVRRLFLLLVALELGNAALLGLGRYHTGIPASVGSRYQYTSILCTLPFVGYACEGLLARVFGTRTVWRTALATVLVLAATWQVARPWPLNMPYWARGRGTVTRELLFRNPRPPRIGAIPGIPDMPTRRARKLVALYHLH